MGSDVSFKLFVVRLARKLRLYFGDVKYDINGYNQAWLNIDGVFVTCHPSKYAEDLVEFAYTKNMHTINNATAVVATVSSLLCRLSLELKTTIHFGHDIDLGDKQCRLH